MFWFFSNFWFGRHEERPFLVILEVFGFFCCQLPFFKVLLLFLLFFILPFENYLLIHRPFFNNRSCCSFFLSLSFFFCLSFLYCFSMSKRSPKNKPFWNTGYFHYFCCFVLVLFGLFLAFVDLIQPLSGLWSWGLEQIAFWCQPLVWKVSKLSLFLFLCLLLHLLLFGFYKFSSCFKFVYPEICVANV